MRTRTGQTGLEEAFARSQAARPVLLWAQLIGIALTVVSPLLWTGELWRGLAVRGPGMGVAMMLPYVVCTVVGHGIYRVLVRSRRSDATFEA